MGHIDKFVMHLLKTIAKNISHSISGTKPIEKTSRRQDILMDPKAKP